ncbi:MAG: UDP-glucose 4-epimerase GalE [Candidatus Riflebacteria bacterium]|nr:UDP-glucose 4-epimerase GalE [Candidatus Riflebacteria bacterium]
MKVLLTGGAGFIGSHCAVELYNEGFEPYILDNFVNSKPAVADRIRKITGKDIPLFEGDILDTAYLEQILEENKIEAVMHFAALKSVGESVGMPLEYYKNNVAGTLSILEAIKRCSVKNFLFSSSCTVYGENALSPVTEGLPLGGTTNPYGTSKFMVELILRDFKRAFKDFQLISLRYFNPIGAHPSGHIGEDSRTKPTNLMPLIMKAVSGQIKELSVFGNDYPTHDGTCIRDYIHVVDLARAHVAAIKRAKFSPDEVVTYNIGTGHGFSVMEMLETFEKTTGETVPFKIVGRRPGDLTEIYADPSKALNELGWKAEKTLEDMCKDSWNWQTLNPEGYPD